MNRSPLTPVAVPSEVQLDGLSFLECRIRASRLLKEFRSGTATLQEAAALRFRTLPLFHPLSTEQLLAQPDTVRLKHALAVIAREQGYPTWEALKEEREFAPEPGRTTEAPLTLNTERFFQGSGGAYLNHWFARYEEARETLDVAGGYLFPYRHQFFVCEEGLLRVLGIDPHHPAWARIGHDWVQPADLAARDELLRHLAEAGYAA